MSTRTQYSAEVKAKAVEALKTGSVSEVSDEMGIPKPRLYQWAKEAGQPQHAQSNLAERLLGKNSDGPEARDSDGDDDDMANITEAEEQISQDLRRALVENEILRDEYNAIKDKYIDLHQDAR